MTPKPFLSRSRDATPPWGAVVCFALVHLVVVFVLLFVPVGVGVRACVGGDAVELVSESY